MIYKNHIAIFDSVAYVAYNMFLFFLHQDLKSEPDLLVEIITRSATSQTAGMWADSATELGGSEWSER